MRYPIVILHGWGVISKRYDPLVRELRNKKFRVFAIDFPVNDDKPSLLSDYVDYLQMYLQQNNIKKPVFIGHSFGGRVALKYQWMYPNDVTGLILTGTPGYSPFFKKVFVVVAKIGKIFFHSSVIRDWYYYIIGARDYYQAKGVMKSTFKNIVSESLVTYMKSVRIPTLLVWGEDDLLVPVWVAKKMKKTIEHSRLVIIPNSGHNVSFAHAEIFVSKIYDFLLSLT